MTTIRRTVEFTVSSDGAVSPSIPQYGGVKGEHCATQLKLTVTGRSTAGKLVRLRFAGGDGSVLSSDLINDVVAEAGRTTLVYDIPALLTRVGGQLGVRLVLSEVDEHGTETETFLSQEAVLYFDEAVTENGTPFWTGVSEMLKRTAVASQSAAEARDAARDARDAADTAAYNAQRNASAALTAKDRAEEAAGAASDSAQSMAASVQQIGTNAKNIESLTQLSSALMRGKLSKDGHAPNKYLGTDSKGNVVEKDTPQSGGGASSLWIGSEGVYIEGVASGSITADMFCFITDADIPAPPTPDDPDTPEQGGVEQSGSVLYVYSGVSVAQSGDALTIGG